MTLQELLLIPRSPMWQRHRKEHLKKEPVCQYCRCKKNLEVHHIIPVHVDWTLELTSSNLITLCMSSKKCHLKRGHKGSFFDYEPNIRAICDKRNLQLK